MKAYALAVLILLPLLSARAWAGDPPKRTIDDDIAVLEALCGIDRTNEIEDAQKRLEFLNESYKVIEKHTRELLDTYKEPADRGRIYYAMANIYVQTGLIQPDRCIAYVQKALECKPSTADRAQLHVYWGDALQKLRPRKEAVVPYLKGLKDLLKFKLPATAPRAGGIRVEDEDTRTPAQRKAAAEDRERLLHLRELVLMRNALREHAAALYAQKSAAPGDPVAELESVAQATLEDKDETRAVVEETRKAIAARQAEEAQGAGGAGP